MTIMAPRYLLGCFLSFIVAVDAYAQVTAPVDRIAAPDSAKTEKERAAKAEAERVAQILQIRDSVRALSQTFFFGVSIGWRHVLASTGTIYRDAVIDPTTNNVRVDQVDQGDVVLSGTVTAFPWKPGSQLSALGFLANVNLAAFGEENVATFNKSIEGGGGLALRLSQDFAIGLTVERVFCRRLREWVTPDRPLVVEGEALTSLSQEDGRFFRDDNMSAVSLKFLYHLK